MRTLEEIIAGLDTLVITEQELPPTYKEDILEVEAMYAAHNKLREGKTLNEQIRLNTDSLKAFIQELEAELGISS